MWEQTNPLGRTKAKRFPPQHRIIYHCSDRNQSRIKANILWHVWPLILLGRNNSFLFFLLVSTVLEYLSISVPVKMELVWLSVRWEAQNLILPNSLSRPSSTFFAPCSSLISSSIQWYEMITDHHSMIWWSWYDKHKTFSSLPAHQLFCLIPLLLTPPSILRTYIKRTPWPSDKLFPTKSSYNPRLRQSCRPHPTVR